MTVQGTFWQGEQNEGESWVIVDRVYWPDGVLADQSTSGAHGVATVSLAVFDEQNPDTAIYTVTAAATSAYFFATPQTADSYWTLDAQGYNFRDINAPSNFQHQGGHTYRFEYTLNAHASNVIKQKTLVYRVRCKGLATW